MRRAWILLRRIALAFLQPGAKRIALEKRAEEAALIAKGYSRKAARRIVVARYQDGQP